MAELRRENCSNGLKDLEKYLAPDSLLSQNLLTCHEGSEKTQLPSLPCQKEGSRGEVSCHFLYMQEEASKSYLSFSP